MKHSKIIPMCSLQLFAEGGGAAGGGAGDGGTGSGVTGAAAVPQAKGVKAGPLADVKYGIQEERAPAAEVQTEQTTEKPDRNAEFEKLIRGEYKDLYDARVQDTVQKRLRSTKETVEKYTALFPVLEMLAQKYGISDPGDAQALAKALNDDNNFWEELASQRGMSVLQLKQVLTMERENADLRRQMQEKTQREQADQLYASWLTQGEQMKAVYPSFDLKAEMGNTKFQELLRSGIDVRTAYEVVHKDEIIPAAMQFTAKTVEQKIAKSIASGASRPTENGNSAQVAAVVKNDVTKLTRADRQEIARRVARGEKIRF